MQVHREYSVSAYIFLDLTATLQDDVDAWVVQCLVCSSVTWMSVVQAQSSQLGYLTPFGRRHGQVWCRLHHPFICHQAKKIRALNHIPKCLYYMIGPWDDVVRNTPGHLYFSRSRRSKVLVYTVRWLGSLWLDSESCHEKIVNSCLRLQFIFQKPMGIGTVSSERS